MLNALISAMHEMMVKGNCEPAEGSRAEPHQVAEIGDDVACAECQRNRGGGVSEQPVRRRQLEQIIEYADKDDKYRRHDHDDAVLAKLTAHDGCGQQPAEHGDPAHDRHLSVVGLSPARLVYEANAQGERTQHEQQGGRDDKSNDGGGNGVQDSKSILADYFSIFHGH